MSLGAQVAPRPAYRRRAKYAAVPTVVHGFRFASKREAARYGELLLLGMAGEIRNLELQPRFELVVDGEPCGRYRPDFRYEERHRHDWRDVVEEIKGYRVRDYILRRKVFCALHPQIVFREVR